MPLQVGIRSAFEMSLHDHSTINEGGAVPLSSISGHTKVPHDALAINADQVDGEEAINIVTKVRCDALGIDHATLGNVLTAQHHALPDSSQLALAVACLAYRNAVQNIVQNTDTKILYNAEIYDIGGNFDADGVDSDFTFPSDGYYSIIAATKIVTGLGTGKRLEIWFKIDAGVPLTRTVFGGGQGSPSAILASKFHATSGQVLTVWCKHNDTAARNIEGNDEYNYVSIQKIGE